MQTIGEDYAVEKVHVASETSNGSVVDEALKPSERHMDVLPSEEGKDTKDMVVECSVKEEEDFIAEMQSGRLSQETLGNQGLASESNMATENTCVVSPSEEQLVVKDVPGDVSAKQNGTGQLIKGDVDTAMAIDMHEQGGLGKYNHVAEQNGLSHTQDSTLTKLHQVKDAQVLVGSSAIIGNGMVLPGLEKQDGGAENACEQNGGTIAQGLENLQTTGGNVSTAGVTVTAKQEMGEGEAEEMDSSSSGGSESSSDDSEEEVPREEELETMEDSDFHESSGGSSSSSSSESDSEEDYFEEEEGVGVSGVRAVKGLPAHYVAEKQSLPLVPKVDLQLQHKQSLLTVGTISAVMGEVVVVESSGMQRVLDTGSVLWLRDERIPLGLVDDLFGPVQRPFYSVRFNTCDEVPAGAVAGCKVGYTADHAVFVLNDANLHKKGCDASGVNDRELPEHEIEHSDDEQEQEARKQLKQKRKGKQEGDVKTSDGPRPERTPQEGRGGGRSRGQARGRGRGQSSSGQSADKMRRANPVPRQSNGRDTISAQMEDMHFRSLDPRHPHPMEAFRSREAPPPQWQPPLPQHPPQGTAHPHFNGRPGPPLPPGPHPHQIGNMANTQLAPQHPPEFRGERAPSPSPWPAPPEQPMLPHFVHQPALPFAQQPETMRPMAAGPYPPSFNPPMPGNAPMMQSAAAAHVHPPMPPGMPMAHSSAPHMHPQQQHPPRMPGEIPMVHSNVPPPHMHPQNAPGLPSNVPSPQGPWGPPPGHPQSPMPGHVPPPGGAHAGPHLYW